MRYKIILGRKRMKRESEELLRELTEGTAVPGYEEEIRSILEGRLKDFCKVERDKLGSIIFIKEGGSERPKVMLPAHMDEIGFMVKRITDEGFVKFTPLGGWWSQVLLAQRVRIHTRKGVIEGLVGSKPPHILPKEEKEKVVKLEDMFIDIGASSKKEAQERLGVRPGDPIVPVAPLVKMTRARYAGKAFDDRVGCAMMVDALKRLRRLSHPNTAYGVGTAQEEVGCRGAKTSAFVINPDVCIVLEVGIAGDVPGIKPDEVEGKLGGGPQICILDRAMIPNLKLRDFVLDVAEKEGIKYQLFAMTGGATDGGSVHLHAEGVPTVYIGVPTRYIHSHYGVIDGRDYENTVKLVVEVVRRLDTRTVESFV